MNLAGIDPREWIKQAIVGRIDPETGEIQTEGEFVQTAPDEALGDVGPLVEVVVLPQKTSLSARVGSVNASDGLTALFPFHGGDEVVLAFPGGDPNKIPIVVSRLNSETHPTPKEWDNDTVLISLGGHKAQITNDAGSFIAWGEDGDLTYRHPSGLTVQFDNDGHFKILDADKNLLFSDAKGVNVVTGSGAVMKLGDKVQLFSPSDIEIGAQGACQVLAASMNIGDATAQHLVTFNGLKQAIMAAAAAAVPGSMDGGKAALTVLQGFFTAPAGTPLQPIATQATKAK